MRGKRSKTYKKLMGQYYQTFGFREPYQVLVDSQMIREAARCTMDISPAFERTLRGTVKPMITQCSIRHLYALPAVEFPNKDQLIDTGKTFERRKCNHHELEEPLPELECFEAVVVKNGENKHRYCVAAQNQDIRRRMKEIPGVPSIIINRSVMILEPMTDASKFRRDGMERSKFLKGIVDARMVTGKVGDKRKRELEDADPEGGGEAGGAATEPKRKRNKRRGRSGPNPLAMKKRKPKPISQEPTGGGEEEGEAAKKRRKRKHGKGGDAGAVLTGVSETVQ